MEYFMYFEFYELKNWVKRSANNRRRMNQRLLKGRRLRGCKNGARGLNLLPRWGFNRIGNAPSRCKIIPCFRKHISNFTDGNISRWVYFVNDISHPNHLISVDNKINHRFISV